ncbi:MAG: flagellin, partial [Crenarchaeota archaeon]|nr:flagellin [Thermoproteota archaeon]
MVSTTISQALLTIVAISLAVALAVAVMSQLSNILNSISIAVNHRSEALRMVITITNAYYDPVSHNFHIFVKNTGDVPYSDLDNIDVYLGNATGALDYYNISTANITEYG